MKRNLLDERSGGFICDAPMKQVVIVFVLAKWE
jgi:hypothetical protein